MRGTFANIRLRNQLAPGTEGGITLHLPDGERDHASSRPPSATPAEGVPLVVLAGKEYGSGSSRDWAAKGTPLLGVRAVIAESLRADPPVEPDRHGRPAAAVRGRARRAESLGLTGHEVFAITGLESLNDGRQPEDGGGHRRRRRPDRRVRGRGCASTRRWRPQYYRHGGILPYMLRQMAG